jgi:hypothetical protein
MYAELLATRDAARNERDALRSQLSGTDRAREEELRLLRAEVARLRPSNASLGSRVNQLKGELDGARDSLRRIRRGDGTSRWRRRGGTD